MKTHNKKEATEGQARNVHFVVALGSRLYSPPVRTSGLLSLVTNSTLSNPGMSRHDEKTSPLIGQNNLYSQKTSATKVLL
jgi:hypothetical protein